MPGYKTEETEMAKPWIKNYPAGVPAEIDPTQYETVAQMLEEAMKKYASRAAFICMGKSITYARSTPPRAAWAPGCNLAASSRAGASPS
jgi:long-chain acyl-CoA synthetase